MSRPAPMGDLAREKGVCVQRSVSQQFRLLRPVLYGVVWFLAFAAFVIIVLPATLFLNVLAWNMCGVFVSEETPGIPFPPSISSSVRFGDWEIAYGTPAFIPAVVVLMLPTIALIVVSLRKAFQCFDGARRRGALAVH